MSKKIAIFLLVLVLIVTSLIIYRLVVNDSKNKSNNVSGGTRKSSVVYGMIVSGKSFSDFLSLTGTLEANEIVDIRPEISGIIESLNFTEGSDVNAGQVLVKLNDSELRAQLSQALTRSTLAAENERRAKLLLNKEAISQEEYDVASAEYRTAKAQIQLIQAQLKKTSLLAPFSGKLGLRNFSKGSYITSNDVVTQLVNTNKIKLQFSVSEKYAHLLKNGAEIGFTVQGIPLEFKANIYAIEPVIDPVTRTLTVRAIVDNSDNALIPGAFANIVLPLQVIDEALLIPTEALIPIQNGKKIFIQKDGKAKEVLVETGARTDSTILITKGLTVGDTVLTSGVMSLREGTAVKVQLK